jgi:hypothetical protein
MVRGVGREGGGEGQDNDAAWMKTLSRSEINPAFQESERQGTRRSQTEDVRRNAKRHARRMGN